MSHHKKLYRKDFKSIFKVDYLPQNKIIDNRILKHDIHKDKEYIINPGLNDKLTKKYGPYIEKNYEADMYVKWVNKKVEYGAFAQQDIKKGDMVTEYTGIVQEDVPFDEDNLYLWDYPTIFYHTLPNRKRRKKINFCINAEKAGNFARFINHSLRKYQNVAIQIVAYGNFWHVLYIAKRDISKGEQLLTYYGLEYWKDRKIVPEVIVPDK